jgi:hypothetical protein
MDSLKPLKKRTRAIDTPQSQREATLQANLFPARGVVNRDVNVGAPTAKTGQRGVYVPGESAHTTSCGDVDSPV